MTGSITTGRTNNSNKLKPLSTNSARRKGSGSLSTHRYRSHSNSNGNNDRNSTSNNNGSVNITTTAPSNHESQIQKQCFRTKLCSFFKEGKCNKGERCSFAHAKDELHAKPDFSKTRLCVAFGQNKCNKRYNECNFAHGEQDLKKKINKSAGHHHGADEVLYPLSTSHLSSAASNTTTTSTIHNTNSDIHSTGTSGLDNEDSHELLSITIPSSNAMYRCPQLAQQQQQQNNNANLIFNHINNVEGSALGSVNDFYYNGSGAPVVSPSVLPNIPRNLPIDDDVNSAILYSDDNGRLNAIATRERGLSMCSVNSLVNSQTGYIRSPQYPINPELAGSPPEYYGQQQTLKSSSQHPNINNDPLMFRNFATTLQPTNFVGVPSEHHSHHSERSLPARSQDFYGMPDNSGNDAPHVYIPGTAFAPTASTGNPNENRLHQQQSRDLMKSAFQSGDSRHSVHDEHSDLPAALPGTSIMSEMYFNTDFPTTSGGIRCGYPNASDFVNLTTSPTFTTEGANSGLPTPPSFVGGPDPVTAAMYGPSGHHYPGSQYTFKNGTVPSGIMHGIPNNSMAGPFDNGDANRPRTHSAMVVPHNANSSGVTVNLTGVLEESNAAIPPLLSHKLPSMFSSELGSDECMKGLYFKDGTGGDDRSNCSETGGHGTALNNSNTAPGCSNTVNNDAYFNPSLLVNFRGPQHQL